MRTFGINGIDHVILGVANLEAACTNLDTLGFVFSPRGVHETYGTHNTTIVLAGRYIEIFSFYDAQIFPQHFMLPIMRKMGDGVIGVGYATADAQATNAALENRYGALPYPVSQIGRQMRLPDGQDLEAKVAVGLLPAALMRLYFGFTCQHFTPEHVWRKEWLEHPNHIRGFDGITVAVANQDELTHAVDALRLLDAGTLTTSDDTATLTMQGGWIRAETLESLQARLPTNALNDGVPLPFIASLSLTSSDLGKTAAYLRKADTRVVTEPSRITIPARVAHGCVFEVTQQRG